MYIYAGKPSDRYQDKFGTQPKIQLNDKFATVQDVGAFVFGNDSDADGINNDFDVDSTEGTDANEDGIDDTIQPETGTFQMTFSGNVVNIF